MIKKILYLITAINIFSLTEYEKEILKKIKEKNGFTHNCVDGKFE